MGARTVQSQLHVDVHRRADGGVVIRLAGALVVRSASTARRALDAIVDGGPAPSITIDLAEISAIDAAGLAAVTAPAIRCRHRSTTSTIVPPQRSDVSRYVDRVGVIALINRARP